MDPGQVVDVLAEHRRLQVVGPDEVERHREVGAGAPSRPGLSISVTTAASSGTARAAGLPSSRSWSMPMKLDLPDPKLPCR